MKTFLLALKVLVTACLVSNGGPACILKGSSGQPAVMTLLSSRLREFRSVA